MKNKLALRATLTLGLVVLGSCTETMRNTPSQVALRNNANELSPPPLDKKLSQETIDRVERLAAGLLNHDGKTQLGYNRATSAAYVVDPSLCSQPGVPNSFALAEERIHSAIPGFAGFCPIPDPTLAEEPVPPDGVYPPQRKAGDNVVRILINRVCGKDFRVLQNTGVDNCPTTFATFEKMQKLYRELLSRLGMHIDDKPKPQIKKGPSLPNLDGLST